MRDDSATTSVKDVAIAPKTITQRIGIITARNNLNNYSTVQWYNSNDLSGTFSLPNVPDVYYAPATTFEKANSKKSTEKTTRVRRVISRNQKHLDNFRAAFNLSAISDQEIAFCEIAGPAATAFGPLELNKSTHQVFIRGSDNLPADLGDIDEICIVTGTCLFSGSALHMIGIDGQEMSCLDPTKPIVNRIDHIKVSSDLTLYEWESIFRLSRFICDLAAELPATVPLTINVDLPKLQYHLVMLEATEAGFVDQGLLAQWWAEVEDRSNRLATLLMGQLRRGLDAVGRIDAHIQHTDSLSALELPLRRYLCADQQVSVAELGVLLSKEPMWPYLLELLPPHSYTDLAMVSYSQRVLGPALTTFDRNRRSLVLEIENPTERRTYGVASKIAAKLGKSGTVTAPIVGLYPMERLFTSAETGRTSLYRPNLGDRFITETDVLSARTLAKLATSPLHYQDLPRQREADSLLTSADQS